MKEAASRPGNLFAYKTLSVSRQAHKQILKRLEDCYHDITGIAGSDQDPAEVVLCSNLQLFHLLPSHNRVANPTET